ncbi:hypothetical protein IB274_29335 [Pseudomonas sp. PDM18]|uniref:hypothetical protein n=1 Tax=unclassified Pseudomonas TaxID=196821 RepID=UPI001785F538|nr:hypothetical protein [Pseudomonas sp. PDM18]MBD9680841.1 hypothetical protein [Pseudomonas sp. PDM18]
MHGKPKQNSRRFYYHLKKRLDIPSINRAERNGLISSKQAERLRSWAVVEKNKELTRVTILSQGGVSIGEVIQIKSELPWLATPLGNEWPAGMAFKEMDEAVNYLKTHAKENMEQ